MILIHRRFLSAEHIQYIYVRRINDQRCSVIVQMTSCFAEFGDGIDDAMTKEMAFELQRRIIQATIDYKNNDKAEVQQVDIPTYKEVHPEEESETS